MATKATESDDEDPRGLARLTPNFHQDPLIYPELGILAVFFSGRPAARRSRHSGP